MDLPQFMAIARTLWPEICTSDAVSVFRDAHEETQGEVDFQVSKLNAVASGPSLIFCQGPARLERAKLSRRVVLSDRTGKLSVDHSARSTPSLTCSPVNWLSRAIDVTFCADRTTLLRQAFLKQAERWQFFGSALQLPAHIPSRSDFGADLDLRTRQDLGALVHLHYAVMRSVYRRYKSKRSAWETLRCTVLDIETRRTLECLVHLHYAVMRFMFRRLKSQGSALRCVRALRSPTLAHMRAMKAYASFI